MKYTIKKATKDDIPYLQELFTTTVQKVNIKDYSKKQIKDWAYCGKNKERWSELFDNHNYYICILKNTIVGYSSLNKKGFIHSMFVSKDYLRKGIGQKLMNHIINLAHNSNIQYLEAEVSITAKPFFEANGFVVFKEQQIKANKMFLINYLMRKKLEKTH